ncbi:MAG TPA: DUF5955 family protein [Pseudonocardiaceae bacterium]|nr:DUF5955 family protein [Pseudonocardiaceae bacterium]
MTSNHRYPEPQHGANYGIVNTGSGTVTNSGGLAVGPNAAASTPAAPSAETEPVRQLIAELRALIADTPLTAGQRAAADAELNTVAAGVREPRLERGKLTAALDGLTTAVGSVAALAGKIASLHEAIAHLFH